MFVKVWLYEGGLDTYLSTPVGAQCLFDVNNVSYVMISDTSQKDWLSEYEGRSDAKKNCALLAPVGGPLGGPRVLPRESPVGSEKGSPVGSENAAEAAPDKKRARLM